MIRFSKKMEYSLLILYFLHINRSKLISAKEISNYYNIAFDSVSKLMQKLSKSEFLTSEQGSQGGYTLKIDLADLTMLDLINAISGKLKVVKCIDGNCEKEVLCNIKKPVEILNKKLNSFYSKIYINELFEGNNGKRKYKG